MSGLGPRQSQCPRRQAGFTLIEVIASFIIFSLVFATTLQLLSGSSRNALRSAAFTQAALWAQNKMDALGIDPAIETGQYSGEFDDEYRWELSITPYEFNDGGAAVEEFPVDLFHVELEVFWGEDEGQPRRASFKTLRAATPERISRTANG